MLVSDSKRYSKLRIAVLGCGPIGILHAEVVSSHPDAQLIAVCAPSPRNREAVANRFKVCGFDTLHALLRNKIEVDCVLIATPDTMHIEHSMIALGAGLHVLCEKPLGYSVEDAQSVCRLAEKKLLHFGVTFNRRYAFGYRHAKQLVDEGAIGKIRQILVQVTDGTPSPKVATRPDVICWTLLGHHFDLIRYFGGEVARVSSRLSSGRSDGLIDDVMARFVLENNITANLAAFYRDDQTRTTERCELIGTEGNIVIEDVTRGVIHTQKNPDRAVQYSSNTFVDGDGFYASLSSLIADYIDRVARNQAPSVPATEAVYATEMAAAVLESDATQTLIHLK
jgi:UDP-N-acetylglucosamine 3-dehydrogenase